jgi:hypothetical protein
VCSSRGLRRTRDAPLSAAPRWSRQGLVRGRGAAGG